MVEFNAAFAKAARNPYGDDGGRKKHLRHKYRKILFNWPEVERLGGARALARYLWQILVIKTLKTNTTGYRRFVGDYI